MNDAWQNAVAIGLVLAAAIFVLHRLWRASRGKHISPCRACEDCPAAPERKELISIDPPDSPTKTD